MLDNHQTLRNEFVEQTTNSFDLSVANITTDSDGRWKLAREMLRSHQTIHVLFRDKYTSLCVNRKNKK